MITIPESWIYERWEGDVIGIALRFSVIYINLILLQFETEFLIPLVVTAYGAEADRREGDLSMYAYRSLPFQYKMIRLVQAWDQLSPAQSKHGPEDTEIAEAWVDCYGNKKEFDRNLAYKSQLPNARVNWKEPSAYLVVTWFRRMTWKGRNILVKDGEKQWNSHYK